MSAYNPDNIFTLWQQQAALLGAPDQEIAKAQTEMAIARLITTYLAALVATPSGSGSTFSSGAGAPAGGSAGDAYIDSTSKYFYLNIAGTWTIMGQLVPVA